MKVLAGLSPQLKIRMAGLFYLLIFAVTPSNAASASVPKMIVTLICHTAVGFMFYDLFTPVSRSVSAIAACFKFFFVGVMAVSSLNFFGYLPVLKGAHSASSFMTGYLIALVFFGFHILLIGYLICRSLFLPRFLGVLLLIAGPTYGINTFANFVSPKLAHSLWYCILACWLLAERLLTVWLLGMGLNAQQWKAQASVEANGITPGLPEARSLPNNPTIFSASVAPSGSGPCQPCPVVSSRFQPSATSPKKSPEPS